MPSPGSTARFSNLLAVVTGGGRGIGRAVCQRLAAENASVIVADKQAAQAEQVAEEIRQQGGSANSVQVDTTDRSEIQRLFAGPAAEVDVLVNAAGAMWTAPLDSISDQDWNLALGLNFRGYANMLQHAARCMRRGSPPKGGAIVNVSSTGAHVTYPGLLPYSVSKAAVHQLSKSAAVELAQWNIRVNTCAPGNTDTPGIREFFRINMPDVSPEEASTVTNVLKRLAKPEEVAAGIAFLASNDASFITGTELLVDGGCTII